MIMTEKRGIGYWIHTKECDDVFPYRCVLCGMPERSTSKNYCSQCGAKMNGYMPTAEYVQTQAGSQKYVSFDKIIKRCHKMADVLSSMEFDYSVNKYLGVLYVEDRLYILHDCMVDAYYFVLASSPIDALEYVLRKIEDAEKAGDWVDEEDL